MFKFSVVARTIVVFGRLMQFSPPRASPSTKLFMFGYGAIIAEVQSWGNLCWAAQCILLRVFRPPWLQHCLHYKVRWTVKLGRCTFLNICQPNRLRSLLCHWLLLYAKKSFELEKEIDLVHNDLNTDEKGTMAAS